MLPAQKALRCRQMHVCFICRFGCMNGVLPNPERNQRIVSCMMYCTAPRRNRRMYKLPVTSIFTLAHVPAELLAFSTTLFLHGTHPSHNKPHRWWLETAAFTLQGRLTSRLVG